MGRALDRVVEVLAKRAADAPIGRVVVETRRFVRLMGEGVPRVCEADRHVVRGGVRVIWWVIWRRKDSCRVFGDLQCCSSSLVV